MGEQDLDALLNSVGGSGDIGGGSLQRLFLFCCGLFVTTVPVVFYASPMFDLSLAQDGPQFVCFGVFSSLLITRGYHAVARKRREILVAQREPVITDKGEDYYRRTTREAGGYAVFVVNAAYLGLYIYIVMAFHVSSYLSLSARQNHMVSVLAPAIAICLQGSLS